ncbi:hypothetical protein [Nevskia sp.]|uniref:hypothetical protein n=1 Tax=Nevskia sp. TaxID=1929292 RepID=UPI0025E2D0F0|nr:hypothetical protein [Nevskia sp.]
MIESINNNIEIWKLCSTVVLALLAGLIAWRQSQTARTKLAFDLFERTEKLYLISDAFIDWALRNPPFDDDEIEKFKNEIRAAKWLTDKSTFNYLHQVADTASGIMFMQVLTATPPDPALPEHDQNEYKSRCVRLTELKNWLAPQKYVLSLQFEPFLRIRRPWYSVFTTYVAKVRLNRRTKQRMVRVVDMQGRLIKPN